MIFENLWSVVLIALVAVILSKYKGIVLILKLILNGFGFSWFQVYDCTGVSGRTNFLVSRQIYETLQLTSDNLWENDDFGESDLSSGQVLPLGLSISDPVPINERIKLIKEKLVNIFSSCQKTRIFRTPIRYS